jgi:hypothetical protein
MRPFEDSSYNIYLLYEQKFKPTFHIHAIFSFHLCEEQRWAGFPWRLFEFS